MGPRCPTTAGFWDSFSGMALRRVSASPLFPSLWKHCPNRSAQEYAKGIPLLHPISEIEARATQARVDTRPSNTARMLQAVNSANKSLVTYDDIYFKMSGPALGGVVTAVRSHIVKRVAQLRESLPADQHPDSTAGEPVASEVTTGSVVHITGDRNQGCLGSRSRCTAERGSRGAFTWRAIAPDLALGETHCGSRHGHRICGWLRREVVPSTRSEV